MSQPPKIRDVASIRLAQPSAVAVNARTGAIYVAEQKTGNVAVYSGTTYALLGKVKAGTIPYAMAADSSADKIYVANMYSNDVTVITGPSSR